MKALVESEKIFDVSVSKKPQGIEDKLMEISGIEKVVFLDNNYKIHTIKEANLINKIVDTFSENGCDIRNISNEETSLETVFLALTGKKLRD